MSKLEIAKELTLAAIEKLQFHRQGVQGEAHNQFVANEIAKAFSTIYDAVNSKE